MDDDRSWLKNPILPRPPAVPRFSAAELRAVEAEDERERPSSVMRVASRKGPASQVERRGGRDLIETELPVGESEAARPRRIA